MKLKFLFSIALTITSFFIHGQSEALLKASNSIKIDELKEKMYKYASDEFEGKDTIQVDCKEVAGKKQLVFQGIISADPVAAGASDESGT